MHRTLVLLASLLSVLLAGLMAQQPSAAGPPVERKVTVPLHDGRLHVDELLRELLAAYELDADALKLPGLQIDLRTVPGRLSLRAVRRMLLGTVRFTTDLERGELLVAIDRVRTREVRRHLRSRLARAVALLTGESVDQRRYELALPEPLDPERPLVVLVHGVDSGPELWDDLREFLAAAPQRCQVATFEYPDDDSIERTAAEFARRLRALGRQPVDIVAHSMGGLLARAAVEDPALDPGNVRTLVLVGVPNHGSALAGLRIAIEAKQVLGDVDDPRRFAGELLASVLEHWRDGLGEAGGDLLPDSVFLQRMAARKRNDKVVYHVVLGTRGVLSEAQLAAVQQQVEPWLAAHPAGRLLRPRVERWLHGLDEIVDGKGDGAVSVASGRLDGVEPLLVPLDHRGLVCRGGLRGERVEPSGHPVFVLLARRVGH